MVELTVQQVEKLREMSPLYEFVKEGINIKDIQWAQHWLLSTSQTLQEKWHMPTNTFDYMFNLV